MILVPDLKEVEPDDNLATISTARELAKHLRECEPSKTFDPENFTVRDIRQRQWRHLKTDEAINAALDWLDGEGWIRQKPMVEKRGRPTVRYQVNPCVRSAEGRPK